MSVPAEYNPERPWDRQPWDTELGWSLFGDYLILPVPRRLQTIASKSGYPLVTIKGWAKAGYWAERAGLWDDHLADIRTTTIERVTEETAEEVARRQLTLTRTLQRVASLEIEKLFAEVSREGSAMGTMTPREALRFAERGIILERLILGEATERTDTGSNPMDQLNVEELRQARALQEKAGIR